MRSVHLLLVVLLLLVAPSLRAQSNGTLVFDGLTRSYIVYTPPSYVPGASLPLVFVLHGFTQTAQNIMDVSGFNQVADTANFIVVYPNGVGNAWNTNSGMSGGSTADDIGFIGALTDTLFSLYGIDTTRVYSCGFSAGGYMSHRLACESPRCFAAIASVAGTMSTAAYSACIPTRPVPVLQIHGTADAVVSYNGGFGGVSVDDVIAKWVSLDACPVTPILTSLPNTNVTDNSTVESYVYTPCTGTTQVELLKVIGGGHQWPGTTSLLGGLGTVNRDINASGEIWNFFRPQVCNSFSTTVDAPQANAITLERVSPTVYRIVLESPRECEYSVFDLNGRRIISSSTTREGLLDVSLLEHGLYLLVVNTESHPVAFRLMR